MKNNFIFLVFLMVIWTIDVVAQQTSQYTQYMYNTININPAYAGSRGALSIFGVHRSQWAGLDGAPVTNSFSVNSPINNSNLGIGVSVENNKIGPTNKTDISGDLSYSAQTSANFKLTFGMKVSANMFDLDINKLNPADQGDPQFRNLDNSFTPNIGAGIYWHSDKSYIGLSVPNFIESNRYDDNEIAIFKNKINYYLMGGYVFYVDKYQFIKFKPAALIKMVEGAPVQIDVSANFMFNDKFVAGIAYRFNAAYSVIAGIQVTDGLYLGYSYDLETTSLSNYSFGSHEVFLRFEFIRKQSKITTPRFF